MRRPVEPVDAALVVCSGAVAPAGTTSTMPGWITLFTVMAFAASSAFIETPSFLAMPKNVSSCFTT